MPLCGLRLNGMSVPGPSSDIPAVERARSLDVAECYELLATHTVGRVVFTDGALPGILPVNYVLSGRRIVFRTHPGSRLARAVADQVVAFEVDQLDLDFQIGWSVVATGVAHVLHESDIARAAAWRVAPWAGGKKDRFFAIAPGLVTGRVISP
jgi:nitroimidazol reductase NimA-like FMN-containing flavoprotein (pyridoxamine 5'-phosphate oxidase superfamily)